MITRKRILITGTVQGVGCRPFIYRLADELALSGFVYNDTSGVTIEVQGDASNLEQFTKRLQMPDQSAPLMKIVTCDIKDIAIVDGESGFMIHSSDTGGTPISHVTADSATCNDCLSELNDAGDFRCRYPFINCTNCGPRYSIVKTIPYDRCNTTMDKFDMCDKCGGQYTDVADRRFHAQPVACANCGPRIWLGDSNGNQIESDRDATISTAAKLLRGGKVIGIKGIGGFHLAVDALNADAVKLLRKRKKRDFKPFALMAANIETIAQYCYVSQVQESLLTSPQSPVVLLKKKPDIQIAEGVADNINTLGFMLCYAPLHHILFAEDGIDVLIMTSANISDQPLICDNDKAVEELGEIVDAFVIHDRDVYRQVDDSVVHVIDGKQAMLRRSRGYVPNPVLRKEAIAKDIFAAGADLKNTFCFAKGNQFILSEHIGDLDNALVYRHYAESIKHLQQLFEVEPEVVVCDLHPGYMSTQFAIKYAKQIGVQALQVQHHWAHIASVLAEFDHCDKVIGIVADGTGYGTDGAVWGGECLIASLEGFQRFGHLAYFDLPGADKASKEAVRPLMGILKSIGNDNYLGRYSAILEKIEPNKEKLNIIATQLEKGLNTVETSSMGRLFDAAAAVCGVGNCNGFEAQLPMELEASACENIDQSYNMRQISAEDGTLQLDWRITFQEMITDVEAGAEGGVVSAKFHNTLVKGMLQWCEKGRQVSGINTVALSGGVFCNRYLANRLIRLLKIDGFCVLFKECVPANDGGIALGQAAIAANKIMDQ